MTARQLEEWRCYYCDYPFGERRADMRQDVLRWAVLAPHLKNPGRPPNPEYPYWPHQVDWDATYELMKERDRDVSD